MTVDELCVAFWNVENLFDIEASPRRSEKLERTLRRELGGWSQDVLERKIAQVARIVVQMNGGNGPDILCVAEVENEHVLGLLCEELSLLGRDYRVAHADSTDGRGIDVAFIYDNDRIEAREQFAHAIVKRVATRELFQVNFWPREAADFQPLVVIGNHWPARVGGVYESEPYRIVAAETLAYFHERIQEIHGGNVAVLALGDFNDEPFNRSLVDHALSESDPMKVTLARTARLWNLMWPAIGQGLGSFYFDNRPLTIDQILVSKGLATGASGLRVISESVEVCRFSEMMGTGAYPVPRRFGRGSSLDEHGFSDHYPIAVRLEGS